MREKRKIATRAIQILTQRTSDRNWMLCLTRKAASRILSIIRRVRRSGNRFIEAQFPQVWRTGADLSTIQATRFCRGGDGCLCVARQSSSHLLLQPPPPPSCLLYSETTGRSGWTTLSRSWFHPFFPRIVDESIGHPATFCSLFAATLSMYHGCRQRTAGRSGLRGFVDDSWTRERETVWFRFYILHEYAAARFPPS